jgi:hypothetical protein
MKISSPIVELHSPKIEPEVSGQFIGPILKGQLQFHSIFLFQIALISLVLQKKEDFQ